MEAYFKPLKDKICIHDSVRSQRLNKLNVIKSECPYLIHPNFFYEIREKIAQPLTILFNRSLESNQIAKVWKCANISPM